MPMRAFLGLVAIGACALSCSSAPAGPSAPQAPAERAQPGKGAPVSAAAAATSGSPGETAKAAPGSTGSAAATSTPPTDPPPLTAETLAELPKGAAAYMAVRAGDISRALARLPDSGEILRQMADLLGQPGAPEDTLAKAGVDRRGAILMAVVAAPEKSAREPVDAIARGASGAEVEAILKRAPDATLVRVLIPLERESAAEGAAKLFIHALSREATVSSCSGGGKPCAAFGSEAPLLVSMDRRAAVAAYARGRYLRLDVAVPLFASGPTASVTQSLAAFRDARGGFQGQCSKFDANASVSLCTDAGRIGELGATRSYASALADRSPDSRPTKESIRMDLVSAQIMMSFAAPARPLASDGTLSLHADTAQSSITATWALTKESRAGVEKAFAAEKCSTGQAVVSELLPALRGAFGEPGKGFSEPKKVITAFQEAGFAAFYVAFAGTWPNLIDALSGAAGEKLRVPAELRVCARHEEGRLVITAR